ncbi:hypothetical protein [Bartonella machadoae]|uniref:hypothetical protein n=1 Tax=Bartonella machadoae TaxID=2893471 RepID=UPI001F4CF475|nr:hypothetical protein [Bartonella machadoae]UNE53983.1 hypothetical protein LNM86_10500 [Bartonella machadoae]
MREHNIAWWRSQSLIGGVYVVVAEMRALLLGSGAGVWCDFLKVWKSRDGNDCIT